MSKKNDDIDAGLQRCLQPAAPTAPDGAPDGRGEPAKAETLPPPSAAPLSPPDAPSAPPAAGNVFEAAAVQALIGEPNAWTVKQFCKKCQVDVLPVGKGECPRCHCALRLNFRARRHPVNVLRRDAELAKLVARYRPHTTMVQSTCEMQAGILEQLATLKPGSTEHDRLVKLSQQLFEVLETSLAARLPSTSSALDLAKLTPQQQADRAEALAARLRAIADAQAEGESYLAQAAVDRAAGPSVQTPTDPAGEVLVSTSAPAPAPCTCCGGPVSGCAAIRDDPRWLGEHRARADVQARLEQQRQTRIRLGHETDSGRGILREGGVISYGTTSPPADPVAEMLKQIPLGLPDWYRE